MAMHLYSLLCCSLLANVASAQQPIWLDHFGNASSGPDPFTVCSDDQGGVYVLGTFGGSPMAVGATIVDQLGDRAVLVAKLDTAGTVIWARTAGGNCLYDDVIQKSIVADPSGDRVVLTGLHNCGVIYFDTIVVQGSGTLDPGDGFIAAYDATGNVLWATSAEGFDVRPAEVLIDAAHNTFWFGGIVTAGAYFHDVDPVVLQPGGFVAKYDEQGGLLYAERWLTNGIIEDADWSTENDWVLCGNGRVGAAIGGDLLVLGSTFQDGWLARIDTTGSLVWSATMLSDSNAFAYRCASGPNGDVVVLGGFQGQVILEDDTLQGTDWDWCNFLASYSSSGQLNWVRRLGGDAYSATFDMERGPDGGIYLLGEYREELALPGMAPLLASSSQDMFIARFDPLTGLCQSAYHYGKAGHGVYGQSYGSIWPSSYGVFVADCYDSTFTVGSNTYEPSSTSATDIFVARFDTLVGYTGISSMAMEQGDLRIYANPNRGTCQIDLPERLRMTEDLLLTIYDQQGQVVQRIPMRHTTEGLALDISAQAKGIYHVELGDGKQRYSGTIVFE